MPEETTIESVDRLCESALSALAALDRGDRAGLEAWRVGYLGRRGRLTLILRGLPELPIEIRREVGAAGNRAKLLLERRFADKRAEMEAAAEAGIEELDVTLPGRTP
ncbi:MAG: phenylalanine--tRNA ligase subunit alpha, partial [Gemmatimonadetes bacterium]|nr:phenylalanine--tRNA ligase subunit alpha [Gemmatimonadota bacterium]